MKNIAFDHSGTIQLDAICMDGALDLSTNGQILGEYWSAPLTVDSLQVGN